MKDMNEQLQQPQKELKFNLGKVRGAIAEAGLTQQKVADALGISRYSYTLKLKGKNEFKASELVILTRITGKDISYFFIV